MGGNLIIGGIHAATPINLKKHSRKDIAKLLKQILRAINLEFEGEYEYPLWTTDLLKSGKFLSGSSYHFFNTNISDELFTQKKPIVGDIDVMVDKKHEAQLQTLFIDLQSRYVLNNVKLIGFQRGIEQFSALFEILDSELRVQIDFEFVEFGSNGFPTEWSKFSHSSSWDDLNHGIKGVFHKWLIQSVCSLTVQKFVLEKPKGRGNLKHMIKELKTDAMYTFAVSSKHGGGLRQKYIKTGNIDEETKLPIMTLAPTDGYIQSIGDIMQTILPNQVPSEIESKFWSFTGIIELLQTEVSDKQRQQIFNAFLEKIFGNDAQGMYRNNPDKDVFEKLVAVNYILKHWNVKKPENFDSMISTHKANYKMVPVEVKTNPITEGILSHDAKA